MRCAEDDERALSIGGLERGVGGPVGFDSAEGTDVRRRDRQYFSRGRQAVAQVLGEHFLQLSGIVRISGPGMDRLAHGGFGKGSLGLIFESRERFVLQKSGLAERVVKVRDEAADVELSGGADQEGSQVKFVLRAIEKAKTLDQPGRNDQRGLREMEGVANDQAGAVLHRRRHEVECRTETRKHCLRIAFYAGGLESGVSSEPIEEYRSRLARFEQARQLGERHFRQLGNARLATGLAALAVAAASLGAGWLSPWGLLAPLALFIFLAWKQDRIERGLTAAVRGVSFYQRAQARVENKWIGSGNQGERFRDPQHLFAEDLDLFGRGSLFELLSTTRTAGGESVLAGWLLRPGSREEVLARQAAVAELAPRLDLRQDLALLGDDVRAAVEHQALQKWGEHPAVRFFPGARALALALAVAAVVTFGLFITKTTSLLPLVAVILVEVVFGMAVSRPMDRVMAASATPARELELLALVLERLEREQFSAPALVALRASLEIEGESASRSIARLSKLVTHLDSARNQFLGLIVSPLLWTKQFAMAIEAWRVRRGPQIGTWVAAVSEFEALCSLASFAYEHPAAVFPELTEDADPVLSARFLAESLAHPLIPAREAVANDVALGGETRLWIVSGSNMSGKSTLMRAVGLTCVLAWAGAPVTAARLRLSRLSIGASMRTTDSLADHRSRFYAEISRLREIVDLARAGKPTLFLLDELLSGTNSHDRRIGAEGLIRGLVDRGAIGIVTTHDLALAEIVPSFNGVAINVHFEDQLEGGEIHFDYKLRSGVVTRSNALALMRAVGLDV